MHTSIFAGPQIGAAVAPNDGKSVAEADEARKRQHERVDIKRASQLAEVQR